MHPSICPMGSASGTHFPAPTEQSLFPPYPHLAQETKYGGGNGRGSESPARNFLLKNGELDPFVKRLVRRKARQLAGRAGIPRSDRQDIEQHLYLILVKQLHRFNPQSGHPRAFVATVVERAGANVLRDCLAEKRDHRRCNVSLSAMTSVGEDGKEELAETLTAYEHRSRMGERVRSDQELFELAEDVEAVLLGLSPPLRKICRLLMRHSISAVARKTKIARTTLNDTLRRLRQCFEDAGLQNYL